ncbi:YqaE/Pmp3 family membrane protein [Sphingomicrobium marinum]|uniref:YqaE/Pmp3 family membrane protein n=1 Tax=Sphingomicrobium marinum TaxID=1227950 RepID=UPI00223F1B23|nr:YqaE/Pmp3 family membrane protein [Sphingomicrobium marinum]
MGNLILAIASILLPPLGVALGKGIGGTFLVNLVLTLLFFIPGVLHALYVNFM